MTTADFPKAAHVHDPRPYLENPQSRLPSSSSAQNGQLYGNTTPERCYATKADAVKDVCRR